MSTESGTWKVKTGLAQMLKGGVIMDVVTPEHAKIAEDVIGMIEGHWKPLTKVTVASVLFDY